MTKLMLFFRPCSAVLSAFDILSLGLTRLILDSSYSVSSYNRWILTPYTIEQLPVLAGIPPAELRRRAASMALACRAMIPNNLKLTITGKRRNQWRNRRGGQGGRVSPHRILIGNFLVTYREKRGKEKVEKIGLKLRRKEGKSWKGRWKTGNGSRKSCKKRWGPFFFFLLFTFENDWNLFWVYQNGNFLPGKYISRREKIRKSYFAPSEKYACYAPGRNLD